MNLRSRKLWMGLTGRGLGDFEGVSTFRFGYKQASCELLRGRGFKDRIGYWFIHSKPSPWRIFFYFLYSRSISIKSKAEYCLENKDPKICKARRSRLSLRGKRLVKRDIEGIIFTRCACQSLSLTDVNIDNSDFREAQMKKASLKRVSFLRSNLFKSSFYGAILNDVIFYNTDLRGVIFNFSTLRNVYFKNIDLRDTLFIGTRFENTYYDKKTKLPFSKEQASRMGLFLKD